MQIPVASLLEQASPRLGRGVHRHEGLGRGRASSEMGVTRFLSAAILLFTI